MIEVSQIVVHEASDGSGLQLWVQPSGTRLWRLAYRFDGKQKLLSLGSYPVISLADARQARDEAKHLLKAGADPAQERKFHKATSQSAAYSLKRLFGDQRSPQDAVGETVADRKRAHSQRQLADERAVDTLLYIEAVGADAGLPALRYLDADRPRRPRRYRHRRTR
ncbi:MAG: DUF4102 domain-containing protein [Mesorhizobium sp.]|nr:MAG: DUF4102 domain-containing protein [Mesorhizobium sp.]TIP40604.1 MAG: DUF4102 domain-containing protein [Mesorhizobium sp.]